MSESYAINLDLNLLRVFLVVAEQGSVTAAAAQLYLTQPAVSAALRRLHDAVGAPLFTRSGRGLSLTHRGEQLVGPVRNHLGALLDAALSPETFDPATSQRTLRLGLADTGESWLLPTLLRRMQNDAPQMRFITLPVQFRTVSDALTSRQVDLAVTVADDLPSSVRRQPLLTGGFVCLFDPRHARVGKRLTAKRYFDHDHVIVSYNGDLRGIVEDLLGQNRRIRCSLSSFNSVGAVVDGSAMLATVPEIVALEICRLRPHLCIAKLPLAMPLMGTAVELLWSAADDDDPACRFVRDHITAIAKALPVPGQGAPRRRR